MAKVKRKTAKAHKAVKQPAQAPKKAATNRRFDTAKVGYYYSVVAAKK